MLPIGFIQANSDKGTIRNAISMIVGGIMHVV